MEVKLNEKRCAKYFANEMTEEEISFFKIELILNEELKATYNNYQLIWDNYPIKELAISNSSFSRVSSKIKRPFKRTINKNIFVLSTVVILFCSSLFYYFMNFSENNYTNYILAEKGHRITTYLPDSSKVVINSLSEIKYSNNFNSKREVWLKGEAFFKVVHTSNNAPFIVHTENMDINVLGTEFNVNTEAIDKSVSLEKGKVRVAIKGLESEVNLLPNEELLLKLKTNKLIKRNFNPKKVIAWKDDILVLDDILFKDALLKIDNFYGVEFIVENKKFLEKRITAEFNNQSIEDFISSIEFIANVSITKVSIDKYKITML